MADINKEQSKLLKEIAPYIDKMEFAYYEILAAKSDMKMTDEEKMYAAALGAVMSGLSLARNTVKVTEKIENLIVLQEIFAIHMSVKKLMAAGVIKGKFEGKDENGWPVVRIDGIDKEAINNWG